MTPSYIAEITKLKNEYKGAMFEECVSIHSEKMMNIHGFMGSQNVVCLTAENITHETPSCIAAPLVAMVAKQTISFGSGGRGSLPVPVRIYAPIQLSLAAKYLVLGDMQIVVEPKQASLFCKKITFKKTGEDEPFHFEIVKSWLIGEHAEIEVVQS